MKNVKIIGGLLVLIALIALPVWTYKLHLRDHAAYENARYLLLLEEGAASSQSNDLATAESKFRQAIALDATRYEAYFDLGNMFLAAGNTNAALFSYEKGLTYCGSSSNAILTIPEQATERGFMLHKIELIRSSLSPASHQR